MRHVCGLFDRFTRIVLARCFDRHGEPGALLFLASDKLTLRSARTSQEANVFHTTLIFVGQSDQRRQSEEKLHTRARRFRLFSLPLTAGNTRIQSFAFRNIGNKRK